MDLLLRVELLQAIDQVQLRADRPLGARRRLLDGLDDLARASLHIALVADFHRAFGMDQNLDVGILRAELIDVLGTKHRVDTAVPLPEEDLAPLQLFGRVAAAFRFVRVPDTHLVQRDAHRLGRVAAEVLIGKEQDAALALERPLKHGRGVTRRADDAAMLAAERLRLAALLMYVTGVMSLVSMYSPSSAQQSWTCEMPAMSAIEQPAAMSGSTTVTRSPPRAASFSGRFRQDIGRLGHEVDAAKRNCPATRHWQTAIWLN